jgi:hypothetical protein
MSERNLTWCHNTAGCDVVLGSVNEVSDAIGRHMEGPRVSELDPDLSGGWSNSRVDIRFGRSCVGFGRCVHLKQGDGEGS